MFALTHLYSCGFPEQWEMLFENKINPSRIVSYNCIYLFHKLFSWALFLITQILQCPKYQCLAKKYNLLADAEIYPEAVIDFLNDYSKRHPKFLPAATSAKRRCVGKKLPGMETCPTEKVLACIARTMIFVSTLRNLLSTNKIEWFVWVFWIIDNNDNV